MGGEIVCLSRTVCECALKCGRKQALKCGWPEEEAEDFAAAFVVNILIYLDKSTESQVILSLDETNMERWLNHCALNRLINRRRDDIVRQQRLLPWPVTPDQDVSGLLEQPAPLQTPVQTVMQHEFWQRIEVALQMLPPFYRLILILHYEDQLSLIDLAKCFERSPQSLSNSLLRARRHLRRVLQQQGDSEEGLRSYLLF